MVETIVDETDEDAARLIIGQAGLGGLPPLGRIMAFRDRDGIRGGFLFERYTGEGGSIHVHWAGRDRHWLKKYMLILGFTYMFEQLGCRVVYGDVRAKATGVIDIDYRLGFRAVHRFKGYYPDDDLIVFQMHKNQCKWLKPEEEQGGRQRESTERPRLEKADS